MSRKRNRAVLRREERRHGEFRALVARAGHHPMRRAAPLLLGATAAAALLAALALLLATTPLDAAWRQAASARLVVVPDPDEAAGDGGTGSRLQAVEHLLGPDATPENGAALASLLGAGIDASTLPGLLGLTHAPDPALALRIAAAAPGTTVAAAPADTETALARLDRALRLGGRAGLALALVLALVLLRAAGRLAVAPARRTLRVLAILGEKPGVLARRAGRHAGLSAGAGGLAGATAASPLLLLGAPAAAPAACVSAILVASLLCALVAGVCAGLAARRHVARCEHERTP